MEFPQELANPDVLEALIQHSFDDDLIGRRIDESLRRGDPSSWSDFLHSNGLEDRETLNHVARSGACQFTAVADQLFQPRPITKTFRPDVYLRLLALHCVSQNQDAFQDFMLYAAPVTRQQRQHGGVGVDMEEYTRQMASSRCDGDHITLQALCDALKVNINVVKWTGDDDRCPCPSGSNGVGETLSIDAHANPAGQAAAGPAIPSTAASGAGAGALATSEVVIRPRRSIFVADTLRPRDVAMRLDPRVRGVQLRGRTLWLSLQGEAHFRSLRLRGENSRGDPCAAAVGRREEGSPLPRERSDFPLGRQASAESVPAAMVSPNPPPLGNIAIGDEGDVASPQDMLSPPVNGVSGGTGMNGGADAITTTTPAAAPAVEPTVGNAVDNTSNAGGDGYGAPARVGGEGADIIISTRDTLRDGALKEETGRERQQGKEGKGDDGGKGDEKEKEDCSICMCTVTGEPDAASLDNCVHPFHFDCITKWGKTRNQCPMCKARFCTVTRLRDRHVKRFRGDRRRTIVEEEEPVAARAICLYCGDGGWEDRLILCDGSDCRSGAHTFCCDLEEVPSGEWFCPSCQAVRDATVSRREAAVRRDAILARAWAVDSGSDADGGHDSSAEPAEEENEEEEDDDEEDDDESVSIGVERMRRSRAMDAGRLDAFERGLVNSSGDSVGDEESDDSEDEVIGSARENLYGDGDVDGNGDGDEDGEGAPPYLVDLMSSDPSGEDEVQVLGSVRRVSSGLTRERGRGRGGRRRQSTRGARGGNNGAALLSSRSISRSNSAGARRRRARIDIAATSSRRRGRGRGGRGERTHAQILSAPGVAFGASLSTVGSPGPNLWPNVLASATSAMTPRHVFANFEEEKHEEEEGGDQERQGVMDNLVVQSWADAERARQGQTARRTRRRGETSSATADRLESRGSSSRGQVTSRSTSGSGTFPRPSIAARPSGASAAAAVVVGPSTPSTAAAPATAAASPTSRGFKRPRMMSASSTMDSWSPAGSSSSSMLSMPSSRSPPSTTPSAEGTSSPAPRRVFKRPRLMDTPSSSSSPSSPLPLSSRSPPSRPISPGIRGIDYSRGSGATVDGIGLGRDCASSSTHARASASASASGAKRQRPSAAATGVRRLGQWEARLLVRRLREVAISEKERRSGRSAGRFVGEAVVAATGVRSGDGESKVNETLEELKRVVLGGDAITLDTLLSSQLLTALRLWLEPVENGSTSILPGPQQRSSLLEVLGALPVQKNHLKESGVGKLVVAMATDPMETQENRELTKQIVRRWKQLVFRASGNDSHSATSFQSPTQGPSRVREADQRKDGMTGGRGEALRSHGARPASSLAGTPPLPLTPTRRLYHGAVASSSALPASLRRAIPASETAEERERERRAAQWGGSGSGSGSGDLSGSRACKRPRQ